MNKKKNNLMAARDGFGEGLVEAGQTDKNVVVVSADLTESTRSHFFKKKFPRRFIQLGVSEQAMASIGAGLALAGKIPFLTSFAIFSPGRNWEQIRTGIALSNINVKIVGSHAGITVGEDGASHQMTEDLAIMRVMPNMVVLAPCDFEQTKKAVKAAAVFKGPVYLRFARPSFRAVTTKQTPFKIGQAQIMRRGDHLTIFACGPMVAEALLAAGTLAQENKIQACVVNIHTIKPLDAKTIIACAKQTRAFVTAEDAQIIGGLGSAVSEVAAANFPGPI